MNKKEMKRKAEEESRYPCFKCKHLKRAKLFLHTNTRPQIKCSQFFFLDGALDICDKYEEKHGTNRKNT